MFRRCLATGLVATILTTQIPVDLYASEIQNSEEAERIEETEVSIKTEVIENENKSEKETEVSTETKSVKNNEKEEVQLIQETDNLETEKFEEENKLEETIDWKLKMVK